MFWALDDWRYRELYELEDRHWWFRGRRAVIWSLLRRAGLPPSPRILDAGCGTGRNLVEFGPLGQAEGVDASDEAVAFCHERGLEGGRAAPIDSLPYDDGRFQLILATDVIEHLDDDRRALAELRRVAGSGARLVVTVPGSSWLWGEHDVSMHHRRRYTLSRLQERVAAAGWQPIVRSYFFSALLPAVAAVRLARRLPRTLEAMRQHLDAAGESYEVLVVDDGSRDGTAGVAEEAARRWPQLSLLRLPANRGKGAAVREGMLRASGAERAFSDADLSTPLEELARLRARLGGDCQVAIASRDLPGSNIELHQPRPRELAGKTYNRLLQLLALPGIQDSQCGLKVFRADAAVACFTPLRTERFGFDAEVLVRARRLGWTIAEVPVRWRHVEASRVSAHRDAPRMLLDLLRLRFGRLDRSPASRGSSLESAGSPSEL